MAITELGSKRARTFSMLDDFEAGNTGLDDIIDIPMDIRGQTKKSCSTGFDFNDYLVRFALNGSIGDSNEVYSQEPRLDFSHVTKSMVGEEEVAIDAGNGDDDDDEELDMQVRSNHFDNYSDSREVVDVNFGRDIRNVGRGGSGRNGDVRKVGQRRDHGERDDIMDQVMENVIGKMGQRGNERAVGVITEDEGSDAGDDDSADISEEAIRQIPTSTVAAQDEDEFSEEELFDEAEFDTIDESKGVQQHGDRFDLLDYGFNFKRRPQIYNDEVYYRSGHQRKSPGRVCSPRHRKSSKPSRSNIRVRKNLLNLIVESSDGSLEDATKYATEINSQNSAGIPLPEKTTELVTIPTTGPAVGGIRKAAIVRATEAKTTAAGLNELSMAASSRSRAGFYTATEKMEFVRTKGEDKENENVMKGKTKGGKAEGGKMERGKVKWANRLEW